MQFEWDESKAELNLAKHGVSFTYAVRVFLDPYRIEEEDALDHWGETRHRAIGLAEGRLLFVAYTYRDDRIRVISARKATRNERRKYQEI
jgi:uncharacterized DUF497 family protein